VPSTLATFANLLQNFYVGKVNEQLNNQVFIWTMFRKAVLNWEGRRAIMAIHTTRNTGVGSYADTVDFPFNAGNQTDLNLTIVAKYVAGRFQVSGPTIASAKKGGSHAFLNWAQGEMDRLVTDVKDYMNRMAVAGGAVKGYLNEHKASSLTVAQLLPAGTYLADLGTDWWEYSGDFTPFLNVVRATDTTWVPILLRRCDTFNLVDEQTANATQCWVIDFDLVGQRIEIGVGSNTGANDGKTTVSVAAGHAIAVEIAPAQQQCATPANVGINPVAAGYQQNHTLQPNGIFTNLSNNNHYGQTRNDADAAAVPAVAAAGAAPILQCEVRTMSQAGAHLRIAPTLPRMQQMCDIVDVISGKSVDCLYMNQIQRSTYSSLLIGTLHTRTDVVKKGDGGFLSFSFNGIPIKVDRHVPRGLIIFMCKKTWKIAELQKGGFADLDGNVLSRITNQDAWEGFWRAYYELVCTQPNANMILTGIEV